MKPNPTIKAGIYANLDAMHKMLTAILADAAEARSHMARGEQNMAIGTIIAVDEMLENTVALYRAIRALHRSRL